MFIFKNFIIILLSIFIIGCGEDSSNQNSQNLYKKDNRDIAFESLKYVGIEPILDDVKDKNSQKINLVEVGKTKLKFSLVSSVEVSIPDQKEDFDVDIFITNGTIQQFLETIKIKKEEIRTKEVGGKYLDYVDKKFSLTLNRVLYRFLRKNREAKLKITKSTNSNILLSTSFIETIKPFPKFAKISKILSLNNKNLNLETIEYLIKTDSECKEINNLIINNQNFTIYEPIIYAKFNATALWSASSKYNEVNVNFQNSCFKLTYDEDKKIFQPTLIDGKGEINSQITDGEISIFVKDIDKSANLSIEDVTIELPKGHSFHKEKGGKISPLGERKIVLKSKKLFKALDSNWDNLKLQPKEISYIHPTNLPFYIKLGQDIDLNSSKMVFKGASTKYVHNNLTNIISNDAIFNKDSAIFDFSLDKDGIDSSIIKFPSNQNGFVNTHFPKIKLQDNDFSIKLNDSKITTTNIGDRDFILKYSNECLSDNCQNNKNPYFTKDLKGVDTFLNSDGSIASTINKIGLVGWGTQNQNLQNSFQRKDETSGLFYIAGFIINTKNKNSVANYLLGSRKIKKNNGSMDFLKNYSIDNEECKKGNYFFAGLNVGVEKLISQFNQPEIGDYGNSLENQNMNIAVGGDFANRLGIISNGATKYFIRPSGVTGVFNSNYTGSINIYGYDMDFKKFAFGVVNNVVEKENWIDGVINIKGNGGFKVDFTSLELDCGGGLGKGNIAKKDCQNNINCNQSLKIWKMPIDFVDMAFKSTSNQKCDIKKELELGSIIDIKALKNRLGVKAIWDNKGVAKNATVTGHTLNIIDSNSSTDGYKVALSKKTALKFNQSQAWFENDGFFILPFWERMPTTFRAINKELYQRDLTLVASPTVFDKLDMTKSNNELIEDIKNNEYNLTAIYKWGKTGIELKFPVYYNSIYDNIPIFKGRTLGFDLKVLSAKAGINYITPYKTKASFGASADFKSLKEMKLHIDLNDPKSLKEIDDILAIFGIKDKPLTNSVGKVVGALKFGNTLMDKGLFLLIEKISIEALKQLPNESDPFVFISNITSKFNNVPALVGDVVGNVLLTSMFQKSLDIFKKDGLLDQKYKNGCLNNQLTPQTINGINKELLIVEKAINDTQKTKKFLLDMQNVLNTIGDITKAIDDINKTLDSFLLEDEETNSTICSFQNIHSDGFMKPVKDVVNVIDDINKKIKNINIEQIAKFATSASKIAKIDSKEVEDSLKKIVSFASFLQNKVLKSGDEFKKFFNKELCPSIKDIQKSLKPLYQISSEISKVQPLVKNRIDGLITLLDDNGNVGKSIIITKNLINQTRNIIKRKDLKCTTSSLNSQINFDKQMINSGMFAINSEFDLMKKNSSKKLPNAKADELRKMVVLMILDSKPMELIRIKINKLISPVADKINEVSGKVITVLNVIVNKVLSKVSDVVNKALKGASSVVKKLPIDSAKMDGYAIVEGDELARLHIDASWSVGAKGKKGSQNKDKSKKTSYSFKGAFDMARWGSNGKAGCGLNGSSTDGNIDVKISTGNIGMILGEKKLIIDTLELGFTLDKAVPIGVFGGITSKKGLKFEKFKLYDMGLFVGIGAIETYLGAKTSGLFDKYQLQVAFLLGRTCGKEVINKLDPEVGSFITLPNNIFNGIYIRGGVSFPIYNVSCAFRIGVGADVGFWYLIGPPQTFGGLVGGEAYGQVICLASLKGRVRVFLEKSGEKVKFMGYGWGAVGLGKCEPENWSSIKKVRLDDWCGTGDVKFGAEYKDENWKVSDIEKSAID